MWYKVKKGMGLEIGDGVCLCKLGSLLCNLRIVCHTENRDLHIKLGMWKS